MRLIDADALKAEIATIMPSRTEVFLVVDKMPEAVARCISCTFYRSDGECALHNSIWKPEGFCSWAIRKTFLVNIHSDVNCGILHVMTSFCMR